VGAVVLLLLMFLMDAAMSNAIFGNLVCDKRRCVVEIIT